MSDTYSKILDAALQAFLYQGYDSVTLNQLASQLKLTKGAIYYYFSSKDDLLLAVMRKVLGGLETRYLMQLESDQPILEVLRSWFSEFERDAGMEETLQSRSADIQQCFFQLYFLAVSKFPVLRDDTDRVYVRFIEVLEARLHQATATGELSGIMDCHATAQYIIVLIKGFNLLAFLVPSFRKIETAMIDMLYQQLTQ